uniref:NACHT domain-containing protein n=1 Tax=Astyanax mexicanus TaxID=7994 RepID=A0A8B9HMZ8_ASTMX
MYVFAKGHTKKKQGLGQTERAASPELSCVSMKSNESMDLPVRFKTGDDSSGMSCVSMKSDESMDLPVRFKAGDDSTGVSCVSMKSGESMDLPVRFKTGDDSTGLSCVSMKSKESMDLPVRFKTRDDFTGVRVQNENSQESTFKVEDEKDQILAKDRALTATQNIPQNMEHTKTKTISAYPQRIKSILMEKCKRINEGLSQHGTSTLLNEIYTELYITEGESGEVNKEHEVRQIETASRRPATQEKPINCNDLFKDKPNRTVLTKGVAGIGKTVSVQKFILDWAEEKANQDILLIFPLPFRELNLMKGKRLSFIELICCIFPEMEELRSLDSNAYKILFIFDGLDECRLPLDFQNNESLWDVTESASVDVLLTNLIKGNLLPSALLWITSRPAAASQIPFDSVNLVTEIRGFSDPQKEEYFRKRISDQTLANSIISHMKSSKSLYIMCHIPVFCWMAATVLERMLGEAETGEIPKTLTQMFTHFLIFQIKHRDQKYQGTCDPDPQKTKEIILALGKLAFQQLEKGNLIFYEEDLRDCGIDVRELSVYSGVCTQIFREEFGLHMEKVFSYVHLSVQEFLAALYAFLTFISKEDTFGIFRQSKMSDFLKASVDKALQSENGHLDLFIRFLLGLSLESNQTLLQSLLTQTEGSSQIQEETAQYIKKKIRENPSPDKSINLFYCLNELNDHSLVQEVQAYLMGGDYFLLSGAELSPAQWSALVFVLLNSEDNLEEFDLSKYDPSEECFLRLLPVIKTSKKAVLYSCNLTETSCAALASALVSNSSNLREVDLSYNDLLLDSGVKLLSAALESPQCKLEILSLFSCNITHEGITALVSALKSKPSHLKELNLNRNFPGESGVKQLCDLLKNPNCNLHTLRLCECNLTEEDCAALASALSSSSSPLKELDMSYNKLQDSGVKLLSVGLGNLHSKLKILSLSNCSIKDEGCAALASALKSNPSHLKELNLSRSEPGDSGVRELSNLLEHPDCELEILQLKWCKITEDGCAALASALKSNPSHLKELILNDNKPGVSGVELLSNFLEDPRCKLEKLELCECNLTEENCAALALALNSNASLRQLNLSNNEMLQDSGVKQLSTGLENPQCKLEKLELYNCSIKEEGCAALASAIKLNPSHLKELNLNHNKPGETGVKLLSELLEDPNYKLKKLLIKAPIS